MRVLVTIESKAFLSKTHKSENEGCVIRHFISRALSARECACEIILLLTPRVCRDIRSVRRIVPLPASNALERSSYLRIVSSFPVLSSRVAFSERLVDYRRVSNGIGGILVIRKKIEKKIGKGEHTSVLRTPSYEYIGPTAQEVLTPL